MEFESIYDLLELCESSIRYADLRCRWATNDDDINYFMELKEELMSQCKEIRRDIDDREMEEAERFYEFYQL